MSEQILLNAQAGTDQVIQLPVITNVGFLRLTAAGAIDVSSYDVIVFDADCDGLTINVGTTADSANYRTMVAGDGFAIDKTVTSFYVSGACGYILMKKEASE